MQTKKLKSQVKLNRRIKWATPNLNNSFKLEQKKVKRKREKTKKERKEDNRKQGKGEEERKKSTWEKEHKERITRDKSEESKGAKQKRSEEVY